MCKFVQLYACHELFLNYYIRLYFIVFLLARSNTHDIPFSNILISKKQFLCNNIQLLHLNEINMRFYGAEYNNIERGEAEYNNIERGEAEFNIVVLCSIKPHIDQVQV